MPKSRFPTSLCNALEAGSLDLQLSTEDMKTNKPLQLTGTTFSFTNGLRGQPLLFQLLGTRNYWMSVDGVLGVYFWGDVTAERPSGLIKPWTDTSFKGS